MCDNVPTADAAAEFQAAAVRVRREDRWAAAEQPPAVYSEKRHVSQRWQVRGLCSQRGTGNNKGIVQVVRGPYSAATKLDNNPRRKAAADNANVSASRERFT